MLKAKLLCIYEGLLIADVHKLVNAQIFFDNRIAVEMVWTDLIGYDKYHVLTNRCKNLLRQMKDLGLT